MLHMTGQQVKGKISFPSRQRSGDFCIHFHTQKHSDGEGVGGKNMEEMQPLTVVTKFFMCENK